MYTYIKHDLCFQTNSLETPWTDTGMNTEIFILCKIYTQDLGSQHKRIRMTHGMTPPKSSWGMIGILG